jgi:hypothetical protein
MIELTITLNDVTKRRELLDLVANLPYVEAIQMREEEAPVARRTSTPPLPINGKSTLSEQRTAENASQADPLDREVAFFEEQHEQLVKAFLGQFIAMHKGKVIAHHAELTALVANVRSSQPNAPVLFRQVQETLPPTLHFRSPRMVKR